MSNELECPHFVSPPEHCIHCGSKYKDKPMSVLACAGGHQTWHVIEGAVATCAKCGLVRPAEPTAKDIGISTK